MRLFVHVRASAHRNLSCKHVELYFLEIMADKERFGWGGLGYSPLCCEPLSAAGEVAVEANAQVSVQGRLKSHATFWLEELDPSKF